MSLLEHAQTELDALCKTIKNPTIKPFIPEILKLVKKFGNSGQSGGSASFVSDEIIETLKKILDYKPLAPILGTDDEWYCDAHKTNYQNKRLYELFKDSKNGKPYYLDAILTKVAGTNNSSGPAMFLGGERFYNRQFIKGFPFVPKTFYIEVEEIEVNPDDWRFYIKDLSQFEDAYEYYDMTQYKEIENYMVEKRRLEKLRMI